MARPVITTLVLSAAMLGCSQQPPAERNLQIASKQVDCRTAISRVEPTVNAVADAQKHKEAQTELKVAKEYLALNDEVGCMHHIKLILADLDLPDSQLSDNR